MSCYTSHLSFNSPPSLVYHIKWSQKGTPIQGQTPHISLAVNTNTHVTQSNTKSQKNINFLRIPVLSILSPSCLLRSLLLQLNALFSVTAASPSPPGLSHQQKRCSRISHLKIHTTFLHTPCLLSITSPFFYFTSYSNFYKELYRLGLGKLCQCVKSSSASVFINKVSLEHSHTLSFMYCLWLFSHDKAEVVTEIK